MLTTKTFCADKQLTSQASALREDHAPQYGDSWLHQEGVINSGTGAPYTMKSNTANTPSLSFLDADVEAYGAAMVVIEGFDDEDFLTSRAMYHCWDDRPRRGRVNARRPGRRRSANKTSHGRTIGRR